MCELSKGQLTLKDWTSQARPMNNLDSVAPLHVHRNALVQCKYWDWFCKSQMLTSMQDAYKALKGAHWSVIAGPSFHPATEI